MKNPISVVALIMLCFGPNTPLTANAQSTAFTYQGRLNQSGVPANGSFDLKFTLFPTNSAGTAFTEPVTNTAVWVTNGLFTTSVDLGNAFTGAGNWLELAVSTNGANSFSTLSPRQQVTAAPFALFANVASNLLGTISAGQLSGAISATGIAGVLTNDTTGNAATAGTASNLIGRINLDQLPPGVVTNLTEWQLYTNKTAFCNGQWYNFSNSTTAGINEIEALSPFIAGNNIVSGGPKIKLQSGVYNFSSPILLTNDTIISGNGYYSSVLCYSGPTDLINLQDVITDLPQIMGGQLSLQLANIGLIRLTCTMNVSFANAPYFHNYVFNDFGITTASNFPCVLISGAAANVYQERINLFGPGFGTEFRPLMTANTAVIGEAIWSGNAYTFNNSWAQGLADGVLNVGNSFFLTAGSVFFEIGSDGYSSAGRNPPNAYPNTSWLSVGCAVYCGSAAYQSHIASFSSGGRNNVDIWNDGNIEVDDYEPQVSVGAIATGDDADTYIPAWHTIAPPAPMAVYQQNNVWIVTNLNYAVTNDPNWSSAVTWNVIGNINSGYAGQTYCNGDLIYSWQAGDPTGNIFGTTRGFYINGSLFCSNYCGNANGLTNYNAANLSGTVPATALPGLTTNVSAAGLTWYVTNGLIMRISVP